MPLKNLVPRPNQGSSYSSQAVQTQENAECWPYFGHDRVWNVMNWIGGLETHIHKYEMRGMHRRSIFLGVPRSVCKASREPYFEFARSTAPFVPSQIYVTGCQAVVHRLATLACDRC